MIPLLIDRRIDSLQGQGAGTSLLTLPLGAGSLLAQLAQEFIGVTHHAPLVMPTFDPGESYAERVREHGGEQVVQAAELASVLSKYDSGDKLLVMEAARLPLDGFEVSDIMQDFGQTRGALHLIAVGADAEHALERIDCDHHGSVRRIQRLYSAVNWPELANTTIFMSILPVSVAAEIRFEALDQLRFELSVRGVISRDEPLPVDVVDLSTEAGVLAANDRQLSALEQTLTRMGFEERGRDVLVGRNCTIHPSARLVGPIVIHDGAEVCERSTLIGPTVIGPGAKVGADAIVAQAIVDRAARIEAGTTTRQRVACGVWRESNQQSAYAADAGARIRGLDRHLPRTSAAGAAVSDKLTARRIAYAAKRAFDFGVSLLGLILLSPLLLLVAIAIKIDSRGPVFFTHRRERRGGTEFSCMKFRTMAADAHRLQRELYKASQVDGPQFKMKNDPRVTRLGRFLRVTNIDELPQLFNVLVGDMSLVGPRPSPFRENQICVPWRRARLSVRPGITGLWQVCRSEDRSLGDFHEWIYYDITYVRHYSMWLDLKILIATVLTCGGRWSVPLDRLVRRPAHTPEPSAGTPVGLPVGSH